MASELSIGGSNATLLYAISGGLTGRFAVSSFAVLSTAIFVIERTPAQLLRAALQNVGRGHAVQVRRSNQVSTCVAARSSVTATRGVNASRPPRSPLTFPWR